jgi:hypothetical protein
MKRMYMQRVRDLRFRLAGLRLRRYKAAALTETAF